MTAAVTRVLDFEGCEYRGIGMNEVNIVALLIEHIFYRRHPTPPH
jgi:hypothetical protein